MTAVLLTCAGQRVDIVSAFGRAGAETIAADVNPLAPALYAAGRHFLAPRIEDPGYIPSLAAAVAEHGVELILPLTDLDMTILARNRERLGALVLLPTVEVAERTNDKFVTHLFLQERGIGSPAAWLPDELPADLPYPVLVKARRGFGSRNIFRAESREELDFFLARTPAESFVQEVCAGEEFSMDVFCDLEGRCLNAIPRTMIESKGGESIKGMTIADEELDRARPRRERGARGRRAGDGAVLPLGSRRLQGDRRESPLRRRLPAGARGGRRVPGARARACAR